MPNSHTPSYSRAARARVSAMSRAAVAFRCAVHGTLSSAFRMRNSTRSVVRVPTSGSKPVTRASFILTTTSAASISRPRERPRSEGPLATTAHVRTSHGGSAESSKPVSWRIPRASSFAGAVPSVDAAVAVTAAFAHISVPGSHDGDNTGRGDHGGRVRRRMLRTTSASTQPSGPACVSRNFASSLHVLAASVVQRTRRVVEVRSSEAPLAVNATA
mmetsp:Transcript_28532/g.98509  ORF Transcript_28532/g.98509 Transcript_28532/m.98509 type:complete len:216 (-) Transcript_28532:3399-4046(-)